MLDHEARKFCKLLCSTFPQVANYARNNSPDPQLTYKSWLGWLSPHTLNDCYNVLESWKLSSDLSPHQICSPVQALVQEVKQIESKRAIRKKTDEQVVQFVKQKYRPLSECFDPGMKKALAELQPIYAAYKAGNIEEPSYQQKKDQILAQIR